MPPGWDAAMCDATAFPTKPSIHRKTTMNSTSSIQLALIGLTFSWSAAHAQSPPTVEGRQHRVILELTISSQGAPTTTTKTRRGTTITTVSQPNLTTKRFSNKELLNLLVTKGVITDITGWSVSYFTDLTGANVGAYIVKTGATPISIDAYLGIGKSTAALQGATTTTLTSTSTTSTTVTGSNVALVPLHVGAGFQAQGVYSNDTGTVAPNTTVMDFEVDQIAGSDAYDSNGAPVPFAPATNSILQGSIYGGWGVKANLPSTGS